MPRGRAGRPSSSAPANTTRHAAEIRTFEHIDALYAQRFRGARIPVDVTRYHELAQALAMFFRAMRMKVTFVEQDGAVSAAPGQVSSMAPPPMASPPAPAAAPSGARLWMALAALFAGLVVLAAAYAMFLRR